MPRIEVNGLVLNVQVDGNGEAVLLLHGAPDSAAVWRLVAPRLVGAGYRVVAPDQRGFGESAAPRGVENYAMNHLVADALALMDTLGIEKAHLVGHDWGAAVGWVLAGYSPERFRTFTAISVGHAKAFAAAGFEQLKKSWYIALLLVPGLGERLFRSHDWRLFRRMTAHPEAEKWIADLGREQRLTSCMNWYRANVLAAKDRPNVKIPVLGIWTDGDFALTEAQMTGSAKYVEGPWRYERIEGVSHWLPLDAPDKLVALLLDFFRNADGPRL